MKKRKGTICAAAALAGAMLLAGCGPAQAENTPAARTAEQAAPAVTAAQDPAAEAPAGTFRYYEG